MPHETVSIEAVSLEGRNMSRILSASAALFAACSFTLVAPAASGFQFSNVQDAQANDILYLVCHVRTDTVRAYSRPIPYPRGSNWAAESRKWWDFVYAEFGIDRNSIKSYSAAWCQWDQTLGDAERYIENNFDDRFRQVSYPSPETVTEQPAKSSNEIENRKNAQTGTDKSDRKEAQAPIPQPAGKTREQYEAEFQKKLAAQQAAVQEYHRKVAEREAEIARQAAQKNAAQKAAAQAQAAHEVKMAAHQRELEVANRRQEEYEAARRRHLECLRWNKQACDDIVAGKPVVAAEAQSASTDTDPNTCVTTPEIRLNAAFEGNTSASVMNGCGQPVDIRICLKRNSGWNCGVTSAVASQARAVHSSFEATGEVFVDARTTGNARRFVDPPN